MARKSLMKVAMENYDQMLDIVLSGKEDVLNTQQQAILKRWRTAYDLLRNNPVKYNAIKKLRALYKISETQAAADVECAMRMWSFNNKYHRDFLNSIFIDGLLEKIRTFKDEAAVARLYAVLQKYLQNLPPNELDPKHMEKNNVFIQFSVNNTFINIPQNELYKLPQDQLQKILEGVPHEIVEEEAIEIMNN